MRRIIIGAAAIALAASGALADPGKGNGGGNGAKGGGANERAAMAQGGGGNGGGGNGGGKSAGGPEIRSERGKAGAGGGGQVRAERQPDRADRSPATRSERAERGPVMTADRGKGERGAKADTNRIGRGNDRGAEVRTVRYDDDRRGTVRTVSFGDRAGLVNGCPPGLAAKNNGCLPPGLAKQQSGYRYYNDPSYWGYGNLGDGRYLYDDGYLYRLGSNNSVLGYLPLLGGALSIGNPWPSYYQPVDVPQYYVDYYNLGPANGYRYADDVLYRVDPQTSTIESIAALLTGDQFAVGQPMPLGYDVYNVPYGYQDQYVDGPDSYYRYADGYVYQVDPTTQLIEAAIQLLT